MHAGSLITGTLTSDRSEACPGEGTALVCTMMHDPGKYLCEERGGLGVRAVQEGHASEELAGFD